MAAPDAPAGPGEVDRSTEHGLDNIPHVCAGSDRGEAGEPVTVINGDVPPRSRWDRGSERIGLKGVCLKHLPLGVGLYRLTRSIGGAADRDLLVDARRTGDIDLED